MKIYIKKEIEFEASHRLYKYEGKCFNFHGHNYKVWVYFRNKKEELDHLGMVIDFGDIKKGIGKWIDENWDHAMILNDNDEEAKAKFYDGKFRCYNMPYNPTAENMAIYLLGTVAAQLYKDTDIEMFKIEVFENDKSVAIAEL